jgi:predicted transcriptional regulator of viral defense system
MNGRVETVRQYVDGLAGSGRYFFSSTDAREALGVSPAAAKMALHRLSQQGLVASPARGYYIIVPPEYRALRCPPAEQWVPSLMERLGLRYYAGLLTAAQYHGAAHQRPQEFQVCLERARRPLACSRVRVAFVVRKRLCDVPVQRINTPRGILLISTPEATALDLVGYPHRAGGLNQVATVLGELAEQLDGEKLVAVADTAPPAWSQRLGYLLERVGAADRAAPLKTWAQEHVRKSAVLLAGTRSASGDRDRGWKIVVNAAVEPDL